MGSPRNLNIGLFAVVVSLAMMFCDQVLAHGGDNWEPFIIDGVNDDARGTSPVYYFPNVTDRAQRATGGMMRAVKLCRCRRLWPT